MENATLIISAVSLLCSIAAILFTWTNSQRLKAEAEASVLLRLRSDYESIRAKMDTRYRDKNWLPDRNDRDIWGPYEEYWFFCYREWLTTREDRYSNLWNENIKIHVKAGLNHRPLRFVLATIRKEGSLTDEYAKGFINELIELHGSDFQQEFFPRGETME